MSNELTLNMRLDYASGSTTAAVKAAENLSIDVDTNSFFSTMQTIGSTQEALQMGDLTTPGYFIAVNRGPTDTISIRRATGTGAIAELIPGDVCCFRFSATEATAPYVISSSTNSPVLEYIVFED